MYNPPVPSPAQRSLAALLALAAGLLLGVSAVSAAAQARPVLASSLPAPALAPIVAQSVHHDTSPPLRDLAPGSGQTPQDPDQSTVTNRVLPNRAADPSVLDAFKADGLDYLDVNDPALQPSLGAGGAPATIFNFDGVANCNSLMPPDPVGDIGYDPDTGKRYYMQWVNTCLQIWDVSVPPTATSVLGPMNGNDLWTGFGGACENQNSGDPIVLFDQLSNRWLASQFAVASAPYHQCIAISATADPTGPWHRYAFQMSLSKFNDYPHFGVWPDAYYMSINQFLYPAFSWAGAAAVAFERDQMLAGLTATMVIFDLENVNSWYGGQLPSDLDGLTPPPAGAPNYFAEVDDDYLPGLGSMHAMRLWEFHVDWAVPANSTFGLAGHPNYTLTVDSFNALPCVLVGARNCIPQPGVSSDAYLDAVGDRIMHRLAYRNFGTHESLVLNHTVDAGSGRAGVRWYEVRSPGASPVIAQQGTFAPADGISRWMASIAQDHMGNILLGYSASGPALYPSVRYTGRLAGDPSGLMTLGEASLYEGGGSQTATNSRWGDYSSLTLDPVDDCTFWYTNEYYASTSSSAWRTRIGSFKLPSCSIGPQGRLQGVVTDTGTLLPIAGALVRAETPTTTVSLYTSGSGLYGAYLLSDTYTVTAAAYGYTTQVSPGIGVISGTTTTVNFALDPAPQHVISGFVTDLGTAAPLWASIGIQGAPFAPPFNSVQTDPQTGFYSLTVPGGGQVYTLTASALLHTPEVRGLGALTGDADESFALSATTSLGGLAGFIRNAYTHDPVPGALVTVQGGGVDTTDTNGYYEILNLAPGAYTATVTAALYSPAVVTNVQVLTGVVTYLPIDLLTSRLELAPAVLSQTLMLGQVLTEPAGLVLTNTGDGALIFSLVEQQGGFQPLSAQQPSGGGPDLFGYTWLASTEPGGPLYDWVDATGGTALNLADDGAATINLPFEFNYYGASSASLRVSNNGLVIFDAIAGAPSYLNAPLSHTTSTPNNALALFWDDLDDDTGNVYWTITGTAPYRRAVIAWHDRPHWQFGGGVGAATFEMVLFEDGDILYQYQDVDFGSAAFDSGASATVGLRGPSDAYYLQYAYNSAALSDGLALCFDHPASPTQCGFGPALPWVSFDPITGTLPGGVSATQPIQLSWTAADSQPGLYLGYLWVGNNDPAAQPTRLPVRLNVLPLPPVAWFPILFR